MLSRIVFLLLLVGLLSFKKSDASPVGSCWVGYYNGTWQRDPGAHDLLYELWRYELCFVNATHHTLAIKSFVTTPVGFQVASSDKGVVSVSASTRRALPDTTLTGYYSFSAPQQINLDYASESACQQPSGFCCTLCPWVLDYFGGEYGFSVGPSLTSPAVLSLHPAMVPRGGQESSSAEYQWGHMDYSIPLECSSSCGTFDDVVPTFSGGNGSFSVCRFSNFRAPTATRSCCSCLL